VTQVLQADEIAPGIYAVSVERHCGCHETLHVDTNTEEDDTISTITDGPPEEVCPFCGAPPTPFGGNY